MLTRMFSVLLEVRRVGERREPHGCLTLGSQADLSSTPLHLGGTAALRWSSKQILVPRGLSIDSTCRCSLRGPTEGGQPCFQDYAKSIQTALSGQLFQCPGRVNSLSPHSAHGKMVRGNPDVHTMMVAALRISWAPFLDGTVMKPPPWHTSKTSLIGFTNFAFLTFHAGLNTEVIFLHK